MLAQNQVGPELLFQNHVQQFLAVRMSQDG